MQPEWKKVLVLSKFYQVNLWERDLQEGLGGDDRTILEWILKIQISIRRIALIRLMIRIIGEPLSYPKLLWTWLSLQPIPRTQPKYLKPGIIRLTVLLTNIFYILYHSFILCLYIFQFLILEFYIFYHNFQFLILCNFTCYRFTFAPAQMVNNAREIWKG